MRYLLIAGLILAACRPQPKPPASGDTASVDTATVDTSVADTGKVTSPKDTFTIEPQDTAFQDHPDNTPDVAPTTLPMRRALTAPHGPQGLPIGPNGFPEDKYGQYGVTGAYSSCASGYFLRALKLAAASGVARICVLPRTKQTTNGTLTGPFSMANIKKEIAATAKAVPDSVAKMYFKMGVLVGYSLMDDMGCREGCWGNQGPLTREQVDSVYTYAQATLWPTLKGSDRPPLFIRVHPTWFIRQTQFARNIDGFLTQIVETQGDPKAWYDRQTAFLSLLGHPAKMITMMNIRNYHNKVAKPATGAELLTIGTLAVTYPGSCYFGGFNYWSGWRDQGRGAAWDSLTALAKGISAPNCRAS